MVVAVVAGLVGGLALMSPAQAQGNANGKAFSPVHFTHSASAGARTSIDQEYVKSRGDSQRGKADKEAFAQRSAREMGVYYDVASLDFLQLTRAADGSRADVIAPRDYQVDSVDLYGNDGSLVAIVGGAETDASTLAYPDGPGFESLTTLSSGSHDVKIYDSHAYPYPNLVGENFSTWQKKKIIGDSDNSKDYYAYVRHTSIDGKGYHVYAGGIRSFKKSGSLTNWVSWSPAATSYSYNCNTVITATAGYDGFGVSMPFTVCSTYDVSIATGSPGDMSSNLTSTTNKTELAFVFYVGATQGSATPVWYDYQKIGTYWTDAAGPLFTDFCDSTDSTTKTCNY